MNLVKTAVVTAGLLLLVLFREPTEGHSQTNQLISVRDPSNASRRASGLNSLAPVLSDDARLVVFASNAGDLVTGRGTTNQPSFVAGLMNVFARDRLVGETYLVSVNPDGSAAGNGDSWPVAISTNGQYILFESAASNLVPGDTNQVVQILLRDVTNGRTLLVSASTNGAIGNGPSRRPVMTPDARFVAFVSESDNLVVGDTNSISDVFVRDIIAGQTTLVSAGAFSRLGTFSISDSPVITPNGRYVAFLSNATNLVSGVPAGGDVYVRDLWAATTAWASSSTRVNMRSNNINCFNQAISADGRFLAFQATASSYLVGPVFRYDLQAGQTDLVYPQAAVPRGAYQDIHSLEMTPDGRFIALVANTNDNWGGTTFICVWSADSGITSLVSGDVDGLVESNTVSMWPSVDSSGRFVAFLSNGTNIVTNAMAGAYHLYVRDTQSNTTAVVDISLVAQGSAPDLAGSVAPCLSADGQLVAFEWPMAASAVNSPGLHYDVFVADTKGAAELISVRDPGITPVTADGWSSFSSSGVSADGRFVAFSSTADNLVPNDTNGCSDVFLRELDTGKVTLISLNTNGVSASGSSVQPSISGDGRYIAFSSVAPDLVAGDTNNAADIFVRDVQSGVTILASVSTNGVSPGNGHSRSPLISRDGKRVLFRSRARSLAPLINGSPFTFSTFEALLWRDLNAAETFALSPYSTEAASMSPDGRFVASLSFLGSNPSSLNIWDSQARTNVYALPISASFTGVTISQDGRRLVYAYTNTLHSLDWAMGTDAIIAPLPQGSLNQFRFNTNGDLLAYATSSGLDSMDTNGLFDIYLYDYQSSSNTLISRSYTGWAANGVSETPDISPDGRFIVYRSFATDLVPGVLANGPNIFLYDRLSASTTLLSINTFGDAAANGFSTLPCFSADGRTIFFESLASDLVVGDFNGASDLFAFRLFASSPIPLFSAIIHPAQASALGHGSWLTWPILPGRVYQVEFKDDLTLPVWQKANLPISILGNQASLLDFASGTQRFYRVAAH
jgi:Tol biopolymer transport system component